MRPTCVSLVLCAGLAACTHSDRNASAVCEWRPDRPSASASRVAADPRQLTADAERAEDVAIRYADVTRGTHSGHFDGFHAYERVRDSCKAALFGAVANSYGVSSEQVHASLLRRPLSIDVAVIVSFALLYCLGAYPLARRLHRAIPAEGRRGAVAAVLATVTTSLVVSATALAIGEVYFTSIEALRLHDDHLSYRADRVPWIHHRPSLFLSGVVMFWLIAGLRYLGSEPADEAPPWIRRPAARSLADRARRV